MMRKVEWLNKNKMKIDTGHKEFDETVRCLTPGNVIDDGYCGGYIRPWSMTLMPDGKSHRPEGHLQDWDINSVSKIVPDFVRSEIRKSGALEYTILYEFHTWHGEEKIVHGYLLTRGHNDSYRYIHGWVTGPTRKSIGIIEVCAQYLANDIFALPDIIDLHAANVHH